MHIKSKLRNGEVMAVKHNQASLDHLAQCLAISCKTYNLLAHAGGCIAVVQAACH